MTGNEFGAKSYEYAVGAIKATSHPPLTSEELRRLQDADSAEFSKLLDEFGWGKGIEGDVNERIEGEMQYVIDFIKDVSPKKELCSLLFFEEDATNLKLFLKGRLIKSDVSDMVSDKGNIPWEILKASVDAWDFSLISEAVNEELKGYENETDPFIISSVADRAIFSHTLERARVESSDLYDMLIKYAEAKNRIAEARLISMGVSVNDIKKLLLPVLYKSIDEENAKTDEITREAKESISKAMYDLRSGDGFAPIAEYFFAKKSEAAELRRILTDKTFRKDGGQK